jgi:putative nucleotidyltransferase with HDIG domain
MTIINDYRSQQKRLNSTELSAKIASIEKLPSVPQLYRDIQDELKKDDDEISIHRIGEIVSRDAAMTSQVLRIVNSAYFGISNSVSNAALAVNLLGIDIIKTLALSIKLFESEELQQEVVNTEALLEHSAAVAGKCKEIVNGIGLKNLLDDSVTAGLLHDIGKLILAANFPDIYSRILSYKKMDHTLKISDLESETFGVHHGEVGAYLFKMWGLPYDVTTAINEHCCLDIKSGAMINNSIVLYIADSLVASDSGEVSDERKKLLDAENFK